MIRLIRTEILKQTTLRTFWWLLIGALAFTLIRFGSVVASAGKIEAMPLGTAASTRDMLMSIGSGTIPFLVYGVLTVTTEVRHKTLAWTFLATPHRWRAVAAKAAAVTVVAGCYAAVATLVVASLTVALFSMENLPLDVINGEIIGAIGGALAGIVLYGIMGVGLGALIRNQVGGLMIPLIWLLVIENLLPSFGLTRLLTWLPGGATAALARADLPGLLPVWAAALLLTGYAIGAVVAGGRAISSQDLT